MAAYELAIQNFGVAEHLLQLYELFRGLREKPLADDLRLAVCRELACPGNTGVRESLNDHLVLLSKIVAPLPQTLLLPDGLKFLLRNAVIVACTAVESFFWDSLRENVLTIVRARRRGADEELRKLTLTLDDYLSIEGYADPNERLKQIILKNFERRTLYDAESVGKIAAIMTVKDFWNVVSRLCGRNATDVRRELDELINRRNQIAHRADRPNPEANPPEETDQNGQRAIHASWVTTRFATAKSLVNAANDCFHETLARLEDQLARDREQELARQTLQPAVAIPVPPPPPAATSPAPTPAPASDAPAQQPPAGKRS
jgi:hypothetical protein